MPWAPARSARTTAVSRDRFGVSWQIVPKNMAELLSRPGAYRRMLGMRKLVIAEF